jgi:succinate dehydrogenase / fumarate reductase membrane anchor subunit
MSNRQGCGPRRHYITPLKRARWLGTAHDGTDHFMQQRATAAVSVLLTLFLAFLMVALAGADYETARRIVGEPLVATALVFTAAAFTWHMKLGMQVIIEDYVHHELLKYALLIANSLFSAAVFFLALVSVGKVVFGV